MIELDIERLAYGGDAVSHLSDGRTAFIVGGCPGDRIAFAITEDRGRFVRGTIRHLLSASGQRVTPACPYFGECGGCSWQHVSTEAQLDAKRSAVADALVRIGHLQHAQATVTPCVPSKEAYGYRNKVEFVLEPGAVRPRLGFHRAGSAEFVAVESCHLLPEKLRDAPKALQGALRYLAGTSDLGLTRVGVRAAAHTRDIEVALWTTPGAFPRSAAGKTLASALPATSIVRVVSKGSSKERRIRGVEVLSGKGFWRERLAGRDYAVSAPSFFQVNTAGAEQLVQLVIETLEPDTTDRILDLYAGVGTFTLALAKRAGDVIAVEAAGSAVRDLRRNLENAGLSAQVIGGDAAREVHGLGRFGLALVDPPRSGLDAGIIEGLARARPRVLAYVSCDPATLARDAARLAGAGFTLTRATPVDLFPQSFHVETVARFERQRTGSS